MKIYVRGWRDETGWYFEVRDNGQGATDEVCEELKQKMKKIRKKVLTIYKKLWNYPSFQKL